jgi:hypothetical protein
LALVAVAFAAPAHALTLKECQADLAKLYYQKAITKPTPRVNYFSWTLYYPQFKPEKYVEVLISQRVQDCLDLVLPRLLPSMYQSVFRDVNKFTPGTRARCDGPRA